MLHQIVGLASAKAAEVEPTPLLSLLAGEFAPRIARLWPAPHATFLATPAPRRHLLFLALSLGRDVSDVRDVLLGARLNRAIHAAVDAPPAGLERALGRMGEVAWAAEDYRELLRLLGDAQAAKALRHAESLEVEVVRRLAALPKPMVRAAGLARELNRDAIIALGEVHGALAARSGSAAADAAAARWAQAASAKVLFELVREDLSAELPGPPHPGTARLKPIASKAEMRHMARRFRNCLADCIARVGSGWSAYYEWEGPPGAIVEICRDHVFGWRFDEARLARNAVIPEAARGEILSDLALMGVHVGRSGWELDRAFQVNAGEPLQLRPLDRVLADAFGAH